MGKRIKLGLIYSYNENWIGGTYYIENLVKSLSLLPENEKPQIILLISTPRDKAEFKKRVYYKHLKFNYFTRPNNTLLARIDFRLKRVLNIRLFDYAVRPNQVDVIFPARNDERFSKVNKKIYWIPDFQELYLKQFFSEKELKGRHKSHSFISKNHLPVVFSSNNAKKDFNEHYPSSSRKYVIPFAVHHPDTLPGKAEILNKYSIVQPYYIVCNQFWQHKNHKVILDALQEINQEINFNIVFTGKPADYRNNDFFNKLMGEASASGITKHINVLGFIPREDQIMLIQESIAIIQPSLFEGWSTVVEDAKALGKPIILSNIPIHREQNPANAYFFDPYNQKSLAEMLVKGVVPNQGSVEDYKISQHVFATNFMKMVNTENEIS